MVNVKTCKRTESDKVLRHKAFEIVSNSNYDEYQRELTSMVYKLFDKKPTGSGVNLMINYQLANKLHKPIITEFKRRKAYSPFKNNIWGVDLTDMKSLTKYNKGIKYFL